ncbi:MAG: glycosyltransferase [Alphaproteobacteria bacterium]|nr:MAG: glycosyltransferase [Alphaproteobacteria bacterium]
MKTAWWKSLAWNLLAGLFIPVFFIAALLPARRRLFVWGSTPIIGNKYWSAAVAETGRESVTIMSTLYAINQRDDFDRFFEDFAPRGLPHSLRFALGGCLALIHVLRHARVLHTSFDGFALTLTAFWRLEALLFRLAGIKVVVLSYGGDGYVTSRVVDTSLRYGILACYPRLARLDASIAKRVTYWSERADIVLVGLMIDGMPRWDVTTNQIFIMDTRAWRGKPAYSDRDGTNGTVRVLHSPNHRDAKGTEFLIDAVERLRSEGLDVELVLLEKVPNERVKSLMQEVDILAEQFISTGYGISGIEGLASGLPVMANLEHEAYTRVFRRYGFLDECPILSTSPENMVRNLRILVTRPDLRRVLGQASRQYAEKYHSFAAAQYMFEAIYDRILDGRDVDLINLFHPLKSPYNRRTPIVEHPLVDSKLPGQAMDSLR